MNGRFGTAVAIVDFNADGINDLAVSAPSVGSETLTYNGQVYVYFGQSTGGLPPQPNVVITCFVIINRNVTLYFFVDVTVIVAAKFLLFKYFPTCKQTSTPARIICYLSEKN